MNELMIDNALEEFKFYLDHGGAVMIPLALMTFVLWYVLGFRMIVLRRCSRRKVRDLVKEYAGGCERRPRGLIETAVKQGVRIAKRMPGNIRPFLNDAFNALSEPIGQYSKLAKVIVLIAPLAGLLGTVSGMIEMFDSLASQTFYSQSGGIAKGISEALFTTQFGLAIAVPGLIVSRALDRKQDRLEQELQQLKDILCSKTWERQ